MKRLLFSFSLFALLAVPSLVAAQSCATPPGYPGTMFSIAGKVITYYVPHNAQGCGTSMEGCIATSCPYAEPLAGAYRKVPVCLDDVRLKGAKYVTLSSAQENYGKYYDLGTITYRSALDGQMHTVENVVGYVHDTGCAFNGTCSAAMRARYGFSSVPRPDKIDVCTTVCPTCDDAKASSYATGRNVSLSPSGRGEFDRVHAYGGGYRNSGYGSPLGYNQSQQIIQPSISSPVSSSAGGSSSLGGLSSTPGTNNDVSGVNSSSVPGPAVATLIVQSQSVRRGNPILVAWSTLGMKTDSVCTLTFAGAGVAQGNGGARPVTIPLSAQAGIGDIVLSCNPMSGAVLEKRASFTIE